MSSHPTSLKPGAGQRCVRQKVCVPTQVSPKKSSFYLNINNDARFWPTRAPEDLLWVKMLNCCAIFPILGSSVTGHRFFLLLFFLNQFEQYINAAYDSYTVDEISQNYVSGWLAGRPGESLDCGWTPVDLSLSQTDELSLNANLKALKRWEMGRLTCRSECQLTSSLLLPPPCHPFLHTVKADPQRLMKGN